LPIDQSSPIVETTSSEFNASSSTIEESGFTSATLIPKPPSKKITTTTKEVEFSSDSENSNHSQSLFESSSSSLPQLETAPLQDSPIAPPQKLSLFNSAKTPPVPLRDPLLSNRTKIQDQPDSDPEEPIFPNEEEPVYSHFTIEHKRIDILTYISARGIPSCILQYVKKRTVVHNTTAARVLPKRGPCFGYRLNSMALRADGICVAYFICKKADSGVIRCNGKETWWCQLTKYPQCFISDKARKTVKLREEFTHNFFQMFSQNPPEEGLKGETRNKKNTEHRCSPLTMKQMGEIEMENEINIAARNNHRAKTDTTWVWNVQKNIKRWYPGYTQLKPIIEYTRKGEFSSLLLFKKKLSARCSR
jgi:hypothetical protein